MTSEACWFPGSGDPDAAPNYCVTHRRYGCTGEAESKTATCQHDWHRPTEYVVRCRVCGLDANEYVLGLQADEAAGDHG